MIYQATHHVNFAQGEMATFSTYIALTLINFGLPYWVAFVITVVVSFVIGVIIERMLMRPMMDAPVLSLGRRLHRPAADHQRLQRLVLRLHDQAVPDAVSAASRCSAATSPAMNWVPPAVTLIVLLAVYLFFRHTKLGLGMRAAAFNPVSARLVGIRVGVDAGARLGAGGRRSAPSPA